MYGQCQISGDFVTVRLWHSGVWPEESSARPPLTYLMGPGSKLPLFPSLGATLRHAWAVLTVRLQRRVYDDPCQLGQTQSSRSMTKSTGAGDSADSTPRATGCSSIVTLTPRIHPSPPGQAHHWPLEECALTSRVWRANSTTLSMGYQHWLTTCPILGSREPMFCLVHESHK